ncbi:centrosomal protein of 72 kDa isoform X4 [Ovis aries]|uniref:centrosomal protein of 72 kDa isoform X4 n=1 Tax=Ovis aries TaxID=9940 RepID=UPI0005FAD3C2|nr:centrosomal protein of 72 kDa isoform X4 [Ovis aries]
MHMAYVCRSLFLCLLPLFFFFRFLFPSFLCFLFPSFSSVVSDSLRPHGLYSPWNLQARMLEWQPFSSPGDLPDPRIEPESAALPADSSPAELRSLSIPGTYQEKITHLGNSLMNLTGLKSLDLSRNSLVSLEGIECLAALESLNLYYNRISSLAEVFRLHSLAGLSEVDLRLNPVAKSESDFRLFVVRMLPGLQQLDDRPVRESERRASQLLFGSEDSLDSKQSFPSVFREERPHHSRVKGTDSSAKKCLVMDADDEAVLSLIAECEWDLSNPPGGMSSSQKESEASLQSSQDSTETEDSGASSQKSSVLTQKMLNALPAPEKYRKRRMPGGRFQAPAEEACLSSLEGSLSVSRRSGSEAWGQAASSLSATPGPEQPRPPSASEACPKSHSAALPGKKATLEALVLEALLDLVDRHWSGHRSLHSSEAFLAQARHILSSVQEFTTTQDTSTTLNEEISSLTLENKSLHSRLAELQQQYGMQMTEVVLELSDTRKEMDYLRQHLDRSLEESSSLKSLLFSMKKDVRTADAPSALNLQISGLQASVKRLSGELVELKQHLEHYDKIQELTQMLQESHSSLVSTNERLLQELGQARAQHQAEVEQLHWSYKELKKTLARAPGSPRGARPPPRRAPCEPLSAVSSGPETP